MQFNCIAIQASDEKERNQLQEVAMYHQIPGSHIYFKEICRNQANSLVKEQLYGILMCTKLRTNVICL